MSGNPFRDEPIPNPYQPAPVVTYQPSPGNPLLIPAILLLSFSILYLLSILGSLPGQIAEMKGIDTSTPEGGGRLVGMITAVGIFTLAALAVLVGSISMLRLRGYTGALLAAVIASIPVCSPCFIMGIPFGIWSFILLRRPDVKARFS